MARFAIASGSKGTHIAVVIRQLRKPCAGKKCEHGHKDEQGQPIDHPPAQFPHDRQGYHGIMFGKGEAQRRSSRSGDLFLSDPRYLTSYRLVTNAVLSVLAE